MGQEAGQQAGRSQTCAIKTRQDCAQLFILYTGMAGRMMMPPMQFIQEARIIDRNLVIIRDLNQCCYQRGVSPELPDIPNFLKFQSAIVRKFQHVREVYCVGSSGGAYGALLSGHFLKAAKVWAFAPPVPVVLGERVTYIDPLFSDVSKVLAVGNGVTDYAVYYNESQELDRVGAERLRGAPGVTLAPQSGQGHGVILHMAEQGQLPTLLPPFVRS